MSIGIRLTAVCGLLLVLFTMPVNAQTYTITSVTPTTLGKVAAAANGATVFTVDPASGGVTKKSGNGARVSSGTSRSLVTISCGNQGGCTSDQPRITISQSGAPTGRANPLTLFTLSSAGATATIVTQPASGNTISATLGPIGKSANKTIYVGMDATYSGDDSAAATGSSNASFLVTVTKSNGTGAAVSSGDVTATVLRALAITGGSSLSFGRITRPLSGLGSVALAAGASAVTVSGNGVVAISGIPASSATLTASGEGGQTLSISVSPSFTMSNGTNSLTVTTDSVNSGSQTLDGTSGAAGTKTVTIGGSFPLSAATAVGSYTGSCLVNFQYN